MANYLWYVSNCTAEGPPVLSTRTWGCWVGAGVEESGEKDPTSKRKVTVGWEVGFLFQAFRRTLLFRQMDSIICYINGIL